MHQFVTTDWHTQIDQTIKSRNNSSSSSNSRLTEWVSVAVRASSTNSDCSSRPLFSTSHFYGRTKHRRLMLSLFVHTTHVLWWCWRVTTILTENNATTNRQYAIDHRYVNIISFFYIFNYSIRVDLEQRRHFLQFNADASMSRCDCDRQQSHRRH